MTKPTIEQDWKKDERRPGVIRVSEHLTLEVRADLGAMLEDEAAMMREVESVVAVAAAAPDMARALAAAEELISHIQQGNKPKEEVLEHVHALVNGARRKAGVLP